MEAEFTAHVYVWNRYVSHFNTVNRLLVNASIFHSSSVDCLLVKQG